MVMAIEVNVKDQEKQESEFPKLMVSELGKIVLFTSKSVGTLIVPSSADKKVGHYCESWCEDVFTDFHGSVTLSNKR